MNTLATVLDAKDRTTAQHVQRVQIYARAIGRALLVSPTILENITTAALLHDIGKIVVDTVVLNKPAAFTPAERVEMARHAAVGGEIVGQLEFHPLIVAGVRHHHERWDGRGYPDRLIGDDIPKLARIISVADTFDACIEDRPYRKGLGRERALAIIREGRETQFDPAAVDAFFVALPEIDEEYAQVVREPVPSLGDLLVATNIAPAQLAEMPAA